MATTTKTLTPTGQTVTLPDMTERPDASVLVDGIGKDADAINAINAKIEPYLLPNNQPLLTYAEGLSAPSFNTFRLNGSSAYGDDLPNTNFKWGTGFIIKRLSTNMVVVIFANGRKPAVNYYNESTWSGWKDMMWNNYS